MDNEDFVRKTWKEVKKGYKDNDSYAPDLFLLDVGNKHFFDADYDTVWAQAAEYTREVLAEFDEWKAAKASIARSKSKKYLESLLDNRFKYVFVKLKGAQA